MAVAIRGFFFQAEDGIRVYKVPGVQTCALPISAGLRSRFEGSVKHAFVGNYAITAENNFSPISLASENAVRNVPGVTVVSGVRAGTAQIGRASCRERV